MTADFNWFLNKQGPRGQQGVKGEQGFSPVITVAENTAKAYILRIQTHDDTFLTPNLRGTVEDLGGTYVRYNPETGQVYAGSPDVATTETYGVIRLATQQDVTDLAQDAAVTPELLANQIKALDLSDDYVTINTPQNINASKTFTSGISLSSIHNSDGAEVLNFVSGEPFKFKTLNNGLNVEGGTLRVIDGSIKSKSTKQPSTDANVYDVVTSFDLATTENAGIVKPDNSTVFIDKNGVISAKTGAIDDNNISTQSSWSSSKTSAEISTVAQEVVGIQGDVASLDTDVSTLKPIVESHTTSIGSINDSLATAMSDITELKEGKQDKLTAGNNITIEGNVISALGGGGGLELCDIGMALYIDETKGLRRYLNGQIVDINTNTQAFLNRLQEITTLHPSLLCTEEEWQTAKTMSAFGQVGKFVFNYSGDEIVSVRLPRVVNVQGLFDLQNLGMTVSAGLPNIKGTTQFGDSNNGGTGESTLGGVSLHRDSDNLWYRDTEWASGKEIRSGNTTDDGTYSYGIGFDASRVNNVYGNSDTVQPEAIQYPYFIQIATGSETENNIINEIELNNPYSLFDSKYSDHELNNLSWLKSEGQWNSKAVYTDAYNELLREYNDSTSIEETDGSITFKRTPKGYKIALANQETAIDTKYSTDGIAWYYILDTVNSQFKLPRTKFGFEGLRTSVGDDIAESLPNIKGTFSVEQGYLQDLTGAFGDGGTRSNAPAGTYSGSRNISSFDASRSSSTYQDNAPVQERATQMYLYFYVGETVQNANLIDAGRIGEQLANKQDKLIRYPIEVSDKSLMPSWYVVYNDGWCEQGGHVTSDRDYYFIKSFVSTPNLTFGNISSLDGHPRATVRKNTYFHYQSSMKANVPADWVAKGYIS